jgi:hypothetical protein
VPQLVALLRAAKDAAAAFERADPLRLYPAVRRRFLPVVAAHFPHLLPKYERAFDERGIVRREYAAALQARVARLRRKVGVSDGREHRAQTAFPRWEVSEQVGLEL